MPQGLTNVQIPPSVIPLLEEVVRSPALAGFPLEIWKAQDHRRWADAFMAFGSLLFQSELPEESLPLGYAQVTYLFDWEAQCQFSGWYAFENRAGTMDHVLESYAQIGLEAEAKALSAALKAWQGSNGSHEAASEAYNQFRHEHSVDLDRLEYMVCHFVDKAESLFYLHTGE